MNELTNPTYTKCYKSGEVSHWGNHGDPGTMRFDHPPKYGMFFWAFWPVDAAHPVIKWCIIPFNCYMMLYSPNQP